VTNQINPHFMFTGPFFIQTDPRFCYFTKLFFMFWLLALFFKVVVFVYLSERMSLIFLLIFLKSVMSKSWNCVLCKFIQIFSF